VELVAWDVATTEPVACSVEPVPGTTAVPLVGVTTPVAPVPGTTPVAAGVPVALLLAQAPSARAEIIAIDNTSKSFFIFPPTIINLRISV
jgi:hypothetical protein